ncbi:hypothetical protein [Lentzea sp. NEAU-D7]|uniref:hypothetical protein n=1 Tax=Lentzea sp. NEAU-D7 TaxID=2994667 RepID=UPI00224ACCC6|nr:hypothetical protein [Lentzea sp. NEAU-D7]MCX2951594.1 hypothetical protein [Lentzea sp. NEAU-D7]
MKRHSPRRRGLLAAAVVAILVAAGTAVGHSPGAGAAVTQHDSASIGWEGDYYGVLTHKDGSFDVHSGPNTTVRFGIYNNPARVQWFNAGGYYPALTTQFERDNSTVTITNFGDRVTIGGRDFVAVYSRVRVVNHDTVAHVLDPAPTGGTHALTRPSTTIQPGQTTDFDYVIAADRFGQGYAWPTAAELVAAGGYDAHYAHMTSYWDGELAQIAQIRVPDPQLANAYRAGYITTNLVKDGNRLNVGENGYDAIFNHDLVGMLVQLLEAGDLDRARDYLPTLISQDDPNDITRMYPDGTWKYNWPWAVYLRKTGDAAFVRDHFATIRQTAHRIESDATGPGGIMKATVAVDHAGYWTVDNQSALFALLTYSYIAKTLGETAEASWAQQVYGRLLSAVNARLNTTISTNGLSYLPCAMDVPNSSANVCGQTNNGNWASMFLFGRWAWDGQLWGSDPSGPMISMIDATYDNGFSRLSNLPKHTFGGYPGVSSSYNAGYGSAGLASTRYRSEGIYGYQYLVQNAQSAPFSWWEGIQSVGTSNWSPGTHSTAGSGSSPHMWGQANASKVLLDSLAAEKLDGTVIIGRGVPNQWLRDGATTSVGNYPIAGGRRMGAAITASGANVTLTLTGAVPAGGVRFELPAFLGGNIARASAGTVDNAKGVVALPPGTTSVTVTLARPPVFAEKGGLDLQGYCTSIGAVNGVVLAGTTAYDWRCVTGTGARVAMDLDDACQRQNPHEQAVFARTTAVADPHSWKCLA